MTQKPSVVVSVVAAVSALAALPVAFLFFAFVTQQPQEAWLEGGWPMYAVLACGALASVLNAAGAALVARGSPWVAFVGLFFSLATLGVGVFGFRWGLTGSLQAIAFAAQNDQRVIMHGAVGEALQCAVLGMSFTAALFATMAGATFVSSFAHRERPLPLRLIGVGGLGLAASAGFSTLGLSAFSNAFKAVAHAGPMDLVVILFGSLEEAQQRSVASSAALLLVVGAMLAAGVLLRTERRALAAVLAALLVPTAGLGALRGLIHFNSEELELLERPALSRSLRPIAAPLTELRELALVLTPTGFLSPYDTPVTDLREEFPRVQNYGNTVGVRLTPELTMDQVVAGLRALQQAGVVSVRLIGQTTVAPPLAFTPPRPFSARLELPSGVRVLLADDATCENTRCQFATLTAQELVLPDEKLPLLEKSERADYGEASFERAIHVKVEGWTLEQLLQVAFTCADQERFAALHL